MQKFIFLFVLFLLFNCTDNKDRDYTFYYWKTNLTLNPAEKTALQNAKVPLLYTRFFDVDKIGGKFQPVGVITKDSTFNTDKKIVPVVFIKNEAFININKEEIKFLAESIHNLIKKKSAELQLSTNNEIQIDCDWTAGTKEDYFQFLKTLKQISQKNITCTLRLHQVKDKTATGIPPVEKVYLMCYATSSPLENSTKNSILDVLTLKNYLSGLKDYPLKLDIALPIYSWGIVTNFKNKHKLINALTIEDLEKNPNFIKVSENNYRVIKEGFYFGMYFSKNFTIKIESVSQKSMDETLKYIDNKISEYNIIYYQLDSRFLKKYKF